MNIEKQIQALLNEATQNPQTLGALIAVYLSESDKRLHKILAERGGVGYTDESNPTLVKAFTAKELETRAAMVELKKLVDRGRAAQELMRRIQEACDHRVFADTAGHPYDFRGCRICDGGMGCI